MGLRQQLNAYNEHEFRAKFEQTDLYKELAKDFPNIIYDRGCNDHKSGTSRQHVGDPQFLKPTFFVSVFYYLSFLLEKTPKEIYDLGCGWNIFKKYIPNVIGVGAEDPDTSWFHADIHDYVDDEYIAGHQSTFESVFSCCVLHYIPLQQLRKRVLDFASMIKPGGRGWVAFNAQRLVEREVDFLKTYVRDNETISQSVDRYIRTELYDLPFTVLVFDVYLDVLDKGMNGNIHIVLERNLK